jgi:hypothetical protein
MVSHYASISRVIRPKAPDAEIRARCRPLRSCPADCQFCTPFSEKELESALRDQSGKAAGPDKVNPWMLSRLPVEGRRALLAICNVVVTMPKPVESNPHHPSPKAQQARGGSRQVPPGQSHQLHSKVLRANGAGTSPLVAGILQQAQLVPGWL